MSGPSSAIVEDTPYLRAHQYAGAFNHYKAKDPTLSDYELDYLSKLNCWRHFDQHKNVPWTGGPNIVKERMVRENAVKENTLKQPITTSTAAPGQGQIFSSTENRVAKRNFDDDSGPQPHPSLRLAPRQDEIAIRNAELRISFLESKLSSLESRFPSVESKLQSLENRAKNAEDRDRSYKFRINKLETQANQFKATLTKIKGLL